MAGLWEKWQKPDGGKVCSFTILTTEPNDMMRPIHNRMPVILRPEDEEPWIDPTVRDPGKVKALLAPFPSDQMECYQVSRLVNNPRNCTLECIEPAGS